jgi:hypothetical protein
MVLCICSIVDRRLFTSSNIAPGRVRAQIVTQVITQVHMAVTIAKLVASDIFPSLNHS